MCFGAIDYCNENLADICIHAPCCIIFIILGTIQITSGIYYFLTIPVFKLIFNICIGCSAVLIGIGGVIVVCICSSSARKFEILLYCSTSIIFLNTVNLILLEFGQLKEVFSDPFKAKLKDSDYDFLPSEYGRLITSVTAIISVAIAFIESQITFCCLNRIHYLFYERKLSIRSKRNKNCNTDQTADLEYVIDKTTTAASTADDAKNNYESTKIEVYAQSWVFEENIQSGTPESSNSAPLSSPSSSTKSMNRLRTHQRKISELSETASERQALQMISFSRAPTPTPSLIPNEQDRNTPHHHQRSHSDYLSVVSNKLETKSNTNLSNMTDVDAIIKLRSKIANTAQADAQYATLMAELEQSLSGKHHLHSSHSSEENSITTLTDKGCSSKSSKEGEFSKELEAALQLIQELETPSEPCLNPNLMLEGISSTNLELNRTGSEKTLSAVSLGDFTSPEVAKEFPSESF